MRRLCSILLVLCVAVGFASPWTVLVLAQPTPDPAQGAATDLDPVAEPTVSGWFALTLTAEATRPNYSYLPLIACFAVTAADCPLETPTAVATLTPAPTSTFVPTAPSSTPTAQPTGTPTPQVIILTPTPTFVPTAPE